MKPYVRTKVESAISFIEEHLSESISTTDIAKKCTFSTFHFHRIFKLIVGESPYEYILHKRLERAAWMLKHGKRNIISEVFPDGGSFDNIWVVLSDGKTTLGLLQGMFPENVMTFNPEDVQKSINTYNHQNLKS